MHPPSIRQKVFEKGWEKFSQSKDKFLDKIKEIVVLIIDNRVESVTKIAEQAVSLYEELLERQERYQQETVKQQEAEKAWILQQRQELEQVQKNIKAIIPS
jgi:ATPase subunit of ABC transporter with duplicated ATPase domains